MLMAPAGWAIERAMAAVPLSRIAEQRAIAPEHLSGDVGGSQPPALLPPRAGLTRITAAIIDVSLFISLLSKEVASRIMPVAAAAVEAAAAAAVAAAAAAEAAEAEAEAEAEVVAARAAPSAASCWRHSAWNC